MNTIGSEEQTLEAFRPYFDQHGGVYVLGLDPLSEGEQHAILSARGISDTPRFIEDARARGLEEFLTNPQNLVRLIEAVKGGGGTWPATKLKLYESTTEILLREHNDVRARAGARVYTVAEIRDAAGATCALRLLSDVAGISLADNASDPPDAEL